MVIIVSRDQPAFYQAVKAQQERNGRDRVFLDRRAGERRQLPRSGWTPERRKGERRAVVSPAEQALMKVLGFMVLQRDGAASTVREPAVRVGGSVARPRARTSRPVRRAS